MTHRPLNYLLACVAAASLALASPALARGGGGWGGGHGGGGFGGGGFGGGMHGGFGGGMHGGFGGMHGATSFGGMHAITFSYVVLATLVGVYLGCVWLWADHNLLAIVITHALYDFIALLWLLRGPGAAEALDALHARQHADQSSP